MQIRTRLTLLFVLIAAGILIGVLSVVYYLFEQYLKDNFYEGLQSRVEVTAQTALRDGAQLRPLTGKWLAPDNDTLPYHENISIFNNVYERVFSMRADAPPVSAKDLQDIYQLGAIRFQHYNLLAIGQKVSDPAGKTYAVVVEGYCNPAELIQLQYILFIGFFAGLILVALAGWYYAGQALDPVSRIVGEVESLQPSDLSRRVASGTNHDEMARLAETFNRLLDRVEQAFKMQRMFLSNISHELKNPLTAIRAQLDVAVQRERDPADYKKALQSVLDDIRSLSETEEQLLQLARIYNDPSAIPFASLRLDELLWQARQQLQKRHPGYRCQLEFEQMPEMDDALFFKGNEALLMTAILNLLNNACKYSPDQQVKVRASFQDDGRHLIAVCDNGPGIPPEEQRMIFEPFFRSPRHIQIKGTGVGLSLVQSILKLHQIELSVESPPEGGAVFKLHFPAVAYLSEN